MQPLLGFQSVNSYLLQCLFDTRCVPFLPLEVLVSIANSPVRLFLCDCPSFIHVSSYLFFIVLCIAFALSKKYKT